MRKSRRTVAFRFDAATPEDALAVIEAIAAAGIDIAANHRHRTKRRDEGIFWDGVITVPEPPR
ncbi:MAG: hypothetical protein HOY78_02650 [Saccharothrix sp.]|nr:hypothetical protein [Saccharothrix sp.]